MDDEEFLSQFESLTLPWSQWTHRAHVKVAFLCLRGSSFDQALSRIRRGIRAYNAHHSVEEGPTSGYNETTTHAFVHLVAATIAAYGRTHLTPDAETFCETHPHLLSRHILRLFYSPERRMHPEAKDTFIEPDLALLPKIGS